MLKYKINRKFGKKDSVRIPYSGYVETDYDDIDSTKRLMTCYLGEYFELYPGETVRCSLRATHKYDDGSVYDTGAVKDYIIDGVNYDRMVFTVVADKYRRLYASEAMITVMMLYVNEEGETISETEYNSLSDSEKVLYHLCDECDTPTIVRFTFTSPHEISRMGFGDNIYFRYMDETFNYVMYSATVMVVDDFTIDCYYNPQIGNILMVDEPLYQIVDVTNVEIYADDFFFPPVYFDDFEFTMDVIRYSTSISIPLSNNNSVDLHHETNVSEKFVEAEFKKSIPDIIEWEKDIYDPVYMLDNGEIDEIRRINVNFHFREREGDNFGIVPGGTWNQYEGDDEKDNSDRSDLLCLIGFVNSDVKYQKNRLKNSFARLSFYDSTSVASQNLLSTSTVFLDSGLLYSKFTKYSLGLRNADGYPYGFENIESGSASEKIGVNTEPVWNDNGEHSADENEKFRLSTRMSISDKYSSDGSSEGFYQYFYKTSREGFKAFDIYLKVEFNHAGLGRTLPMMMPFNETDKKIKTFKEILGDWEGDYNGYTFKQYLNFSYIRFKAVFDKERKRCYYYINTKDFYDKTTVDYDRGTHTLSLNLYEANMTIGGNPLPSEQTNQTNEENTEENMP